MRCYLFSYQELETDRGQERELWFILSIKTSTNPTKASSTSKWGFSVSMMSILVYGIKLNNQGIYRITDASYIIIKYCFLKHYYRLCCNRSINNHFEKLNYSICIKCEHFVLWLAICLSVSHWTVFLQLGILDPKGSRATTES